MNRNDHDRGASRMTGSDPAPAPTGFRTFAILWATQSISLIGSGMTLIAATLWATRVIGSRADLSLALSAFSISFILPTLLVMPLAGAWADRHDRRRTMLWANLGCAAASATMALALLTGVQETWAMCALIAAVASLGCFHGAAFEASYVMVVPERLLPRANGMMQTSWALRGIAAPALAAALFALPGLAAQGRLPPALGDLLRGMPDGTALAIALDAASFLAAAIALVYLRIPSPRRSPAASVRPGIWSDLHEGIRFVRGRPALLWLLGLFAASNFAVQPNQVLQPLLVRFDLADDLAARDLSFEAAFAILTSVSSIGGVAGGLVVSLWGGLKRRRIHGVLIPMGAVGLFQVGLGLSSSIVMASALAFALVFMGPFLNAHSQAIWQRETPPELQGRISAMRRTFSLLIAPLSSILAGWLGGFVSPGHLLATLGGLLAIFTAVQWLSPHRARVESRPTEAGVKAESHA